MRDLTSQWIFRMREAVNSNSRAIHRRFQKAYLSFPPRPVEEMFLLLPLWHTTSNSPRAAKKISMLSSYLRLYKMPWVGRTT